MSATYSDLTYTTFPESVSTMERVQDVTIAAKQYVDLYNKYYNTGDFDNANKVLDEHPELLKMIINAYTFNELRDNIIATQRMFLDDTEDYIFTVVKNKGTWSNSVKYLKYNVVFYNSLPYMAIANDIPISTIPTDTNYWYALAIKGDKGESGTGLSPRGYWNENTQYYIDDMVAYNNILWASLSNSIGQVPNISSSVWLKLLEFSPGYLTYDNTASGLTATSMQDAIDELNTDINNANAQISTLNTRVQTVALGGTGATTASAARTALGVAYGTTAGTVCQGNDSRLSDARTPVSHTHTKSQITDFPTTMTPIAHNQAASTITAGTFAGQVVAPAGTDYTTNRIRNVQLTTTDPGVGVASSLPNGSFIDVYE